MAQFGVQVANEGYRVFKIPADAHYHAPEHLHVEGDASGASYFLAAGLIAATPVRVTGIGANSIQGDVAFARELEKSVRTWFGAKTSSKSRARKDAPSKPLIWMRTISPMPR